MRGLADPNLSQPPTIPTAVPHFKTEHLLRYQVQTCYGKQLDETLNLVPQEWNGVE